MALDLSSVSLKSLLAAHERPISVVHHSDKVSHVLHELKKAGVYSAPVLSAEKKVIGLVDLTDIVTYLVTLFLESTKTVAGQGKATVDAFTKHEFTKDKIHHLRNVFFDTHVEKLVNYSKQNKYTTLPVETATLKDLVALLSSKDLHRVAGVDAQGNIVKIFSQSTVVAYFAHHIEQLGPKAQQSVKAAQLGTKPVLTISPDMRTIDAYVLMVENRFSALGFVSSDSSQGSGNISIKDISGSLGDFGHLLLPVHEYINHVRQDSVRDTVPFIHVGEDEPVAKAIQKLAAVGIHRIYFVGADPRTPIGVIALADVLKMFA